MSTRHLFLAVALVVNWMLALIAFVIAMGIAREFAVELPGLSLFFVAVLRPPLMLIGSTALVAFVGLLMALGVRPALWAALAVCLVCDLIFAAIALPLIALNNGLSGSASSLSSGPILVSFAQAPANPSLALPLVSFGFNQIVTIALVFALAAQRRSLRQTSPK